VGDHNPRGQKNTEITYCTQLCSEAASCGDVGICGDAVFTNTPIRMYTAIAAPRTENRVLRKSIIVFCPF
jgi:hypothetical protein